MRIVCCCSEWLTECCSFCCLHKCCKRRLHEYVVYCSCGKHATVDFKCLDSASYWRVVNQAEPVYSCCIVYPLLELWMQYRQLLAVKSSELTWTHAQRVLLSDRCKGSMFCSVFSPHPVSPTLHQLCFRYRPNHFTKSDEFGQTARVTMRLFWTLNVVLKSTRPSGRAVHISARSATAPRISTRPPIWNLSLNVLKLADSSGNSWKSCKNYKKIHIFTY